MFRSAGASVFAAGLVVLVAIGGSSPARAAAVPPTRDFGAAIDTYSAYEPENTCDPTEKPGPQAVRQLILATYGSMQSTDITRPCAANGTATDGHQAGRALDWMRNAADPVQKDQVDSFVSWLLADDKYGNHQAMARRLGVMYMIWNRQMFRMYDVGRGWQPYTGSVPHTDHIHISFSWAGARAQTSFYTGAVPWGISASQADVEKFYARLFQDFVGRPPTAAELSTGAAKLKSGQTDRLTAAVELSRSPEYVYSVVNSFYRIALGRDADPTGAEYWRQLLLGGMSEAQVGAGFYGSDEYYQRSGGTDQAWITALYRDLLGRAPDPDGFVFWQKIAKTTSRASIAIGFYQSPENLLLRTDRLYVRFLGRHADPTGLAGWPPVLAAKGDIALSAALASSDEYLSRALGQI